MLRLSREEMALILSKDLCRLATVSSSGWPHCVPVSYIFQTGTFHVPANGDSKKVRNLERNPKSTILIDEGESREHGIMIECKSTILSGKAANRMREYMRRVKRWENNEKTVIIRLDPLRIASWFKK